MSPGQTAKWADWIIDELVRCGVRTFVASPGFRNAPLTLAAERHTEAFLTCHYDERGCAFFALGWARATGEPAAWITTSGTAAANGFPAVIEAALDHVPMICLTADRPAELRATGANQTIDQLHLFGRYARWFVDMPAPTVELGESYVRSTIDQAHAEAQDGPVHLNCQFREPLVEAVVPERESEASRPRTRYIPRRYASPAAAKVLESLGASQRGVVVIGRLPCAEDATWALRCANLLGWPTLVDIGSQVCWQDQPPEPVVPYYDLILRSPAFARQVTPSDVLHLGGPIVSKALLQFLADAKPQTYTLVQRHADRIDPVQIVTDRVTCELREFHNLLTNHLRYTRPKRHHLRDWRLASQDVGRALKDALGDSLSEPFVAREVVHLLPAAEWLIAGSSMPIRDLQSFAGRNVPLVANRGASGIDGTLATAAGVAAHQGRVSVLLGDLALLHDLNSLALLKDQRATVVVLNNDGGGIFNLLSIPVGEEAFEQCFGAPHGMQFAAAARQFGLRYACPRTQSEFSAAFAAARTNESSSLIEVRTHRADNAAIHQRIFYAVAAAIAASDQ